MTLNGNKDYLGFWGRSSIELRKIDAGSEKICTLSNYPDCNVIKIADGQHGGTFVGNFVALCRKELVGGNVEDKCEIAKLLVSYGGQNG